MALNFNQYWQKILEKKGNPNEDQQIQIKLSSLRSILKQSWELGGKETKEIRDMSDQFVGKVCGGGPPQGNISDIFSGIFGGKR